VKIRFFLFFFLVFFFVFFFCIAPGRAGAGNAKLTGFYAANPPPVRVAGPFSQGDAEDKGTISWRPEKDESFCRRGRKNGCGACGTAEMPYFSRFAR